MHKLKKSAKILVSCLYNSYRIHPDKSTLTIYRKNIRKVNNLVY